MVNFQSKDNNRASDLQLIIERHAGPQDLIVGEELIASVVSGVNGIYSVGPQPMTAIAQMKKGEKAWVQFYHQGAISSWSKGRVTHFTGVLIAG